ncbi:hypothetical protein CEXT_287041 [Caerostris extrusa]|uniref:Uncharacterized protein n=1 Tax=Caerostris extrusa TaxID=172846 RepID=A0AAV4SJA8_CAEEX|nr:hypothetical protein CEXT_287041 [Caerostris extrusa]
MPLYSESLNIPRSFVKFLVTCNPTAYREDAHRAGVPLSVAGAPGFLPVHKSSKPVIFPLASQKSRFISYEQTSDDSQQLRKISACLGLEAEIRVEGSDEGHAERSAGPASMEPCWRPEPMTADKAKVDSAHGAPAFLQWKSVTWIKKQQET